MIKIIRPILCALAAIVVVFASPLIAIYRETKPLVEGGPEWDTIQIFHSGFPIPYMTRTNLSMDIGINQLIVFADIVIMMIAFLLVWEVVRSRKQKMRNKALQAIGGPRPPQPEG